MNMTSLSFLEPTCKSGGLSFKKTKQNNNIYDCYILWLVVEFVGFHGIVHVIFCDSSRKLASTNVCVLYPVTVILNFCVCVRKEWPSYRFMSVSSCRRVDLFKCLH